MTDPDSEDSDAAGDPPRRYRAPEVAEAFEKAREEVRRRREELAQDDEAPDDDYVEPDDPTRVELKAAENGPGTA